MGYLEVDRLAESLWLHHYGKEDLVAWQECYGLPYDKYRIQSGSVSVEQTDDGLMISAEVWPWPLQFEDGSIDPVSIMMYGPYLYPIPEGIGKLVDWDFQIPKKESKVPEHYMDVPA